MTNTQDARGREVLRLALEENIALRCLLGGGCDANNDGLHAIIKQGRQEFCHQCGEMTKSGKSRPWFDEGRLERTKARILAHLPQSTEPQNHEQP